MLFQNTCTHALTYSADLLPIEHLCSKLDMGFKVLQLTKVQGPSADEGPKDWNHIPVPQTTVRRVRADVWYPCSNIVYANGVCYKTIQLCNDD